MSLDYLNVDLVCKECKSLFFFILPSPTLSLMLLGWKTNVLNTEVKNEIEDRFQHSVKHKIIKRGGK